MSENAPSTTVIASHVRLGKDGRRLTPQSLAGMRKGTDALARYRALGKAVSKTLDVPLQAAQTPEADYKSFALTLVPGILKRWGKGAMGRLKGWPAASQIEAGKMILGVAGIALEAKATGSGPLAEMSLQELQARLTESLEMTHKLAAIAGQSSQVPDSDTDTLPDLGVASDAGPVQAPSDAGAPGADGRAP